MIEGAGGVEVPKALFYYAQKGGAMASRIKKLFFREQNLDGRRKALEAL